MSTKPPLFFEKQPFAVRLTNQEIDFVRENYDELFDGDESIQPRAAFINLAEKALIKIAKTRESLPEDLQHIQELQAEIEKLKAEKLQLVSSLNSAVELKDSYERKLKDLENNPAVAIEPEKVEITVERELLPTERLLQLTPEQSFILAEIEKVHNTDAKGILIDRFFMIYQERGNGDFNIKRITPTALTRIKQHFKANQ